MAKRVQALCQLVVDSYSGDAARVWSTAADGRELLSSQRRFPRLKTCRPPFARESWRKQRKIGMSEPLPPLHTSEDGRG
jgi:hypothetical protein